MKQNNTKPRRTKKTSSGLTGEAFDALPAAEKERIYQEIDGKTPEQLLAESKPLSARERAQWSEIKKKMGRPKIGAGAQVISLSVEKNLVRRADAYAKRHHLTRSELFVRGLRGVIG
jgi:hypothetical protein